MKTRRDALLSLLFAVPALAVATVTAKEAPTMHFGDSFKVPGGMGGKDSFVILAQPGEQVDIWRPDEGSDDPRRVDAISRPLAEKMVTALSDLFAERGLRLNVRPV